MCDLLQDSCANCGVRFGITKQLHDQRRKDGDAFYCPNGHSLTYGKSEADKLRRQLQQKQAQSDRYAGYWESEKQESSRIARTAIALRGHITRLKNG